MRLPRFCPPAPAIPGALAAFRALAAFAAALALTAAPARAQAPAEPTSWSCEECHASDPSARMEFPDGSSLPVFVELGATTHSLHGAPFRCEDCHRGLTWPHDPPRAVSAGEYRRTQTQICKRCHDRHFDELRESIHFQELASGNAAAPTCADCHGAHDIAPPDQTRRAVDRTCGDCHPDQAAAYARSVHGKSLAEGNTDVPACSDCHGAHAIADTDNPSWRAASYTICARCHGNPALMAKYELSEEILTTYLDDFHGSSNQLYLQVGYVPERPVATCGDCHGVHEVRPMDDPAGAASVRERATEMCRQCHKDAPEGFERAWLAHRRPTFQDAPAAWVMTWVYRLLIPVMILGLVLHILLHLWRVPKKGH